MKAAVLEGPAQLSVRAQPEPSPGPGEVLVTVSLLGICGSDLHIVDGHMPTARYPLIPGHEATGTVLAAGPGVLAVGQGDRVVIDPGLPCEACTPCREGRANLCEDRGAIGLTRDGAAASLVRVPAAHCYAIPASVSDKRAVLAEPLACVLHGLDLVPPPVATDVLVYGAGTVGLLLTRLIQRLGASTVTVVDTNSARLAGATAAGATGVMDRASDIGGDRRFDLVVDATGAPAAIADGLGRLRRGGTYLQMGVAPPEATVPVSPYWLFQHEVAIVGSMTTRGTFPRAIRLLADGVIDADALVADPLPLDDYAEAIDRVRHGAPHKVTVSP